jgi:hypothetical protein
LLKKGGREGKREERMEEGRKKGGMKEGEREGGREEGEMEEGGKRGEGRKKRNTSAECLPLEKRSKSINVNDV